MKSKILLITILALLLGFTVGVYVGGQFVIYEVVKIAKPFINIDTTMVNQAIFQYKNNIGQCSNVSWGVK